MRGYEHAAPLTGDRVCSERLGREARFRFDVHWFAAYEVTYSRTENVKEGVVPVIVQTIR